MRDSTAEVMLWLHDIGSASTVGISRYSELHESTIYKALAQLRRLRCAERVNGGAEHRLTAHGEQLAAKVAVGERPELSAPAPDPRPGPSGADVLDSLSDGREWYTTDLSDDTGRSHKAINKSLGILEAWGWVTQRRRARGNESAWRITDDGRAVLQKVSRQ